MPKPDLGPHVTNYSAQRFTLAVGILPALHMGVVPGAGIDNAIKSDSSSDVTLLLVCVCETAFPESASTVHDLGGSFHHGVQGRGGGGYHRLCSVGFTVR